MMLAKEPDSLGRSGVGGGAAPPWSTRLVAISGRPWNAMGGAERSLARLCRALAERCDVDVIAPVGPEPDARSPAAARLHVHQADPACAEDLARALHALSTGGPPPRWVYLSDKTLFKAPALLALVRQLLPSARVLFKESTEGKLLRVLAALTPGDRAECEAAIDRVVCISSRIRRVFEQSGLWRGRLVDIPNGVDTQIFFPATAAEKTALRTRLSLSPAGPVVIFAGRFAEKKNLDVVYGAWHELEGRRIHCGQLVLVGAAHKRYDEGILRLMRQDLRSVRIVGPFRHDAEIVPWYRAADVFLAPTSREGLSNAFLEACACGLYPVVSRASGYEDVITDAGFGRLVEERNTSDVIHALEAICSESPDQRAETCVRLRARIVERYDLAHVAAAYLRLFEDLR